MTVPPRQLSSTEVKRLNREWRRATGARLALLLDSVVQPFNVGSIVRSAAAFGAGRLWLCGNTAPLSHPSVGKTALGTDRFLVAEQEPSPVAAAKAAASMGLRVVAVELAAGALPLHEAPLDGDVCLAIGNEDHGCSAALLAVADAVAYIPQPSRVGSLNVAVAAAIAMAEARRREWALSDILPAGHGELTLCTRIAGILADVNVTVPFLDFPRPIAFAHRGGAAHAPENSMTAFEHAVKLGYSYLETDARATSDSKLVAFHDRTLDRVTDATGPIGTRKYADLASIRVAGTEPIPLIEDLLDNWPDIRFNIDLKDEAGISLLPRILRRTGAWDRVCVTSFSGARLRTFRGLVDRPVCMALSPACVVAMRCTLRMSTPGRCAQVPGRITTPGFIRRAQARGLAVHVWTINSRTEMGRLLDLGVDGIMTDETEALRDVLTERGQWPA
ncbi:MAG TPA: glycerophosphodiester phosphodiesterase family protein [Streptosporangiaceae bacterium]